MQRRDFIATSAAAAVGLAASATSRRVLAADERSGSGGDRLMLELRKYHFETPAQQEAYNKFLANAAVPAYNRAGVQPVGVFKLLASDNPELKLTENPLELWLLLPHKSFESFVTLEPRLAADEAFQKAGREILLAPKSKPAFTRYESSLLYAFEGFQKVTPPAKVDTRVLELRTYENPNQEPR